MPLPPLCPKTENSPCLGETCPMYTIDWRSKDEYCMIGYYPAGSRKILGEPVVDTYAKGMKGINEDVTDLISKDVINRKDIPDDSEEELWS
ncbi:MAG: hypothetical protein IBX40_10900 [Methanosarcinales archaeon]|nr:hypothetical protein [Methanosarcinales archaeon]